MITLKTRTVKLFDGSERINVSLKEKIYGLKEKIKEYEQVLNYGYLECPECHTSYNVPINVDTIRRRYPIKWTYQEGIKSLIVDTKIWVF